MVAKITMPKSIRAALNYHEKKVQTGKAVCLQAVNYLNDAKNMNFYQKLHGFETRNSLNERAITKTLHVSLNFDPSEKHSSNKLLNIANDYMQKIGFGEQPFLVYKHEDAGHPHIHIVSTTIKNDGTRINTHNIGRNQSEKARKEIERTYGLVIAEQQRQIIKSGIKNVDPEKVIYGTSETNRSISNAVSAVFNQYKFSSLSEFNAALKQFNVVADRGKEEGRIYKNRGLIYRILDSQGNKVGKPIKASSIACKPILDNLEKKFTINEPAKEALKQRIKNDIDDCLQTASASISNLVTALKQKQIYTVITQSAEGRLHGITFVDNESKIVFSGSDLGKDYSAAALQSKLGNEEKNESITQEKQSGPTSSHAKMEQKQLDKSNDFPTKKESMLGTLMSAKEQHDNVPNSLLQKKRKKKRKYHNL
jgi:hypothetical protein